MMIGSAIVGIVLLIMIVKLLRRQDDPPLPPVRGDELAVFPFSPMPVMTRSEVVFFKKLQQALPEYLIFGQVQLSRLITPNEDEADKSFWLNRINRMSVDYVVIAPDCRTTLVAIELDDWSHDSRRRQQADAKKDKALSSAGIAIMRFHGEQMPSVEELRHEILQVIVLTQPSFI